MVVYLRPVSLPVAMGNLLVVNQFSLKPLVELLSSVNSRFRRYLGPLCQEHTAL